MRLHPSALCTLVLLIGGCRLFESDRARLVRSMVEHPELIDSIMLADPMSHALAPQARLGSDGKKMLEDYFRTVRRDYSIEEVTTSESPEKTLVRVLNGTTGAEEVQYVFIHGSDGWHMETFVIGHVQFRDD